MQYFRVLQHLVRREMDLEKCSLILPLYFLSLPITYDFLISEGRINFQLLVVARDDPLTSTSDSKNFF